MWQGVGPSPTPRFGSVRALFVKFMLRIGSAVFISIIRWPVCGFALWADLQDGPGGHHDASTLRLRLLLAGVGATPRGRKGRRQQHPAPSPVPHNIIGLRLSAAPTLGVAMGTVQPAAARCVPCNCHDATPVAPSLHTLRSASFHACAR